MTNFSIPALPFDNYYKFLTVIGVLLVAIGYYLVINEHKTTLFELYSFKASLEQATLHCSAYEQNPNSRADLVKERDIMIDKINKYEAISKWFELYSLLTTVMIGVGAFAFAYGSHNWLKQTQYSSNNVEKKNQEKSRKSSRSKKLY